MEIHTQPAANLEILFPMKTCKEVVPPQDNNLFKSEVPVESSIDSLGTPALY